MATQAHPRIVEESGAPVGQVDPPTFREAMAHWASGVTVVTVRLGDAIHGMTATSFSSVSIEPPLVLVCVLRSSRTHDIIARTGRFAINILGAEQRALAEQFAGRRPPDDQVDTQLAWQTGRYGAPLIQGATAHVECLVDTTYEAGTHTIVVGRVQAAVVDARKQPLLYWGRDFQRLEAAPIAGVRSKG